jgi:hypothetical protein
MCRMLVRTVLAELFEQPCPCASARGGSTRKHVEDRPQQGPVRGFPTRSRPIALVEHYELTVVPTNSTRPQAPDLGAAANLGSSIFFEVR